jgi:hypothetical protein
MDADGDFVTAWTEVSPQTTASLQPGTLYAKRYSATGDAQGDALKVAAVNDHDVHFGIGGEIQRTTAFPSVAMDEGGDFVVAWEDESYTAALCRINLNIGPICYWTTGSTRIHAASYRANGTPYKRETVIDRRGANAFIGGTVSYLFGVGILGNGGFETVAGRYSFNLQSNDYSLVVNTFNNYIVKSGAEQTLSNIPDSVIDIGFDASGGIDILWYEGTPSGNLSYHVSRFAPGGTAPYADAVVEESAPVSPQASLAVAASGAFAVAWEGGNSEIDAQYFNADGSANGTSIVVDSGPMQANEYTRSPKAALDSSGHLVVLWIDEMSNSTTSTIIGRTVSGP